MKLKCYFERGALTWSNICSFNYLYDKLIQKYPEFEFEVIHTVLDMIPQEDGSLKSMRESSGYTGPNCKYGPFFMVIQNTENMKYFLVSYWDKLNDVRHTNWDLENCVEIFTSIGLHHNDITYKKIDITYTPTSFVGSTLENEQIIENLYSERIKLKKQSFLDKTNRFDPFGRIYPKKLMFRGFTYLFRQYIINDKRFIVNSDKIDELSYVKELDTYALNFSPNGAGEICFRDFEIMGLGTALFRQKLVVDFHNKLIPNYHYISVDFDDIPFNGYYEGYWELLANRIQERFNQVKNDYDFIDFVAKNGREWYTQNGTSEKNADIILNLMDFNKLK
jgi:hypothetical protein